MNREGFSGDLIVDQNRLTSSYGRHGSAAMGCGWVAVYNALRLLDVSAEPETVRASLEKALPLGGWNGTPFYALALYFLRRGFRVHMSVNRAAFGRMARRYPAGILFYMYHKEGRLFPMGHFAALSPAPNGQCHFYNDIPGKLDDIRSMTRFRKDHPACFMLYMGLQK